VTVSRPVLLASGAVAAIALMAWQPAWHGDVWVYTASGRWILDNGAIPRTDPFSWTSGGQPWQSNGWLWGVVLWGAWSAGGAITVALLKPIGVVLIALGTGLAARWLGARLVPACVAAVVTPLLMFPWVSERPQLASYVLFPFVVGCAARAVAGGRLHVRWLVALAALVALWANLHGVALFGAAIAATLVVAASVDHAVHDRTGRPLAAGAVTVVAIAAATLLTPFGLDLHRHSAEVRDLSSSTMSEWYPLVDAGGDAVWPIAVGLVATAVLVWSRAWRRPDVLVPFVVTVLFTVDAVRTTPFLIVMAAIACATVVPTVDATWLRERRGLAPAAVTVLGVAAVGSLIGTVSELTEPGDQVPVAAAEALPADCQLRNDYRLGGWVMFDRPDVPVSADGRNDLYGLDGYAQNAWFEDPAAAERALDELAAEGTTCVLAQRDSPLPTALEAAGWTVVGRDSVAVALVAPN
jgi:hypothetical protein